MEQFISCIPTILCSLSIIFFLIFGRMLDKLKTKQILTLIISILVFSLLNILFNTVSMPQRVGIFFVSLIFADLSFITYLFFMIYQDRNPSKKFVIITLIPLIVSILIELTAVFNPLVFVIENGKFSLKILGLIPIASNVFYTITPFIQLFIIKNGINREKFYMILLLSLNTLISLSCCMAFNKYDLFSIGILMNASIYISCYILYHSSRDILTGAYIRKKFYQDFKQYHNSITGIITFDLNNLKVINDTYGHNEGDNALKTLCNTIYKYLPSKCYLYRFGGDEFTVLCRKITEETILDLIIKIHTDLKTSSYGSAIGYAMYDKQIPLEELLKIADDDMYKNKSLSKLLNCKN